jgi:hypothetical protein
LVRPTTPDRTMHVRMSREKLANLLSLMRGTSPLVPAVNRLTARHAEAVDNVRAWTSALRQSFSASQRPVVGRQYPFGLPNH